MSVNVKLLPESFADRQRAGGWRHRDFAAEVEAQVADREGNHI